MLVGAHVSTSGGLANAHKRGVQLGSEAIQIFSQSPRMWKPHQFRDIDEFNELMKDGPIRSVVIHAVYLINCASNEDDIRRKSLDALIFALRLGDSIDADGVVLHPGALKGKPLQEGLRLAGDAFREALAESERCRLLLENTAGAQGTLGRSFSELAELIRLGGGDERLGVCLDCCHLLASGFEIRTEEALAEVIDDCVEVVGLERLRALHINDSKIPLGGNRDLHADLPDGELGRKGLSVFLSEPRFEGLPALIETKAVDKPGPGPSQVEIAKALRADGLVARRKNRAATGGRGGRKPPPRASQARRRNRG